MKFMFVFRNSLVWMFFVLFYCNLGRIVNIDTTFIKYLIADELCILDESSDCTLSVILIPEYFSFTFTGNFSSILGKFDGKFLLNNFFGASKPNYSSLWKTKPSFQIFNPFIKLIIRFHENWIKFLANMLCKINLLIK